MKQLDPQTALNLHQALEAAKTAAVELAQHPDHNRHKNIKALERASQLLILALAKVR